MQSFIVALVLSLPGNHGDMLVMPLPNIGEKSWAECQNIGYSAFNYALTLDDNNDGFITVPIPGSEKTLAKPLGWSCIPTEWYNVKR